MGAKHLRARMTACGAGAVPRFDGTFSRFTRPVASYLASQDSHCDYATILARRRPEGAPALKILETVPTRAPAGRFTRSRDHAIR